MKHQVDGVTSLVRAAFANVPAPTGALTTSGPDVLYREELAREWSGRDWRDVGLEFVARREDALTFFSAEAFRYYLPSFVLAAVGHYYEAGEVPLALVLNLTPLMIPGRSRDKWESRNILFTPQQRQAICSTLEWLMHEHGEDFDGDAEVVAALDAAVAYWCGEDGTGGHVENG